jgi:hypothetical protein
MACGAWRKARLPLFATESRRVSSAALYLAEGQSAFDSHGRLADEASRASLRQILTALHATLRGSG